MKWLAFRGVRASSGRVFRIGWLGFLLASACLAVAAEPLESKEQQWGFCFATTDLVDKEALGGFGGGDNVSHALASGEQPKIEGVYLEVVSDDRALFQEKYQATTVRLVNGGKEVAKFLATDSRLNLVREAQDTDGTWRAIEGQPQVWCGNSYHSLLLKPMRYWEFVTPRYSGPLKTMLRFRLQNGEAEPIYSEPFAGAIYPEQFKEVPSR